MASKMQSTMRNAKQKERMQEKLRKGKEEQAAAEEQQKDLGQATQVSEDTFVWNDENSNDSEPMMKSSANENIKKSSNNKKKKGKKKKKNKLCSRGINAAKSKYDVYPSAYANGYAVQVCKGTIKGLDGKKRCSGSYCKKKKK